MTILRDLLSAFDPSLPLAQARTIPASWYCAAAIHDLERRAVFGNTWLLVGRAAQLQERGSFLTTSVAGHPILVVRDGEGVLRAFYNVCRHRAAPLAIEPCGRVSRLRCSYHGWTYDLSGRLRGVPEFDGVADFCREDHGLVPLSAAEWASWIWVHPQRAAPPLLEQLSPLPERTTDRVAGLQFFARREYELACNWKVFVDNYLDGGYHVNTIHPGLAGVIDYKNYRTEIHAETSVQLSPLKSADTPVGGVRTGGMAEYWWVYPNLMLNLYEGLMDTNLVLPLGPDRCRVVFEFWFADTSEAAHGFLQESMEVAHQVQLEDAAICEQVQRGLESGAFDTGRFSVRREAGAYHFHQLLGRRLREA